MRLATLILLTSSVLRAESPPLDPYGDRLPEGAVSRIGSSRNSRGEVREIAITPDGRRFVSGTESALVVRETRTLAEVRRISLPQDCLLWNQAISADGKRVAALVGFVREQDTPSHRERATVWNADTGEELYAVETKETESGSCTLALSFDGKKLAALGQVFDVDAKKAQRKVAFPRDASGLLFVGDDRYLVNRRSDQWACWDVTTGGEVPCETAPPKATDGGHKFARDGRLVFFMRDADLVRMEVEYPTPARPSVRFGRSEKILLAAGARIRSASEKGDRLILEGFPRKEKQRFACLYDAEAGKVVNQVEVEKDYTHRTYAGVVTEKDALLLIHPHVPSRMGYHVNMVETTGGQGVDVEVIEMASGKDLAVERGLKFVDGDLSWTPDGKRFRSNDQLWDAGTGKYLGQAKPEGRTPEKWQPLPSKEFPRSINVVSNGVAVVLSWNITTGGCNIISTFDQLRVWDMAANRPTHKLPGISPERFEFDRLNFRGLSRDGSMFAQDSKNRLFLWNARTGRPLAVEAFEPSQYVTRGLNPLTSPSGREVVCTPPGRLLVFDVPSRMAVLDLKLNLPPDEGVTVFDRSPDGRFVALATSADELQVYDLHRGERVWKAATKQQGVRAVKFSPDGRSILTQDRLHGLVWSVPEVKPFFPSLKEEEFAAAWERLLTRSASDCRATCLRLAASGDAAAKFLDGKLEADPGLAPERFDALLARLRSDDFRKRSSAEKELGELDEAALAYLKRTLEAGTADADLAERLARLVEATKGMAPIPSTETLRKLRGIVALEAIGTESSRKTLERLATGTEESAVTREAKATLQRME